MALSPEQQRLREGKLTASVVGPLMTGEAEKILNLWRFMVGDPAYVEPDWAHIWPVRMGEATEALNLEWWEYKTGRQLTRRGEVVPHPEYDWACATLDGFDAGLPGPVDAKHVGGFEPTAKIVERYYPQMIFQMDCTGSLRGALSIIEGAREPIIEPVEWDRDYSAELWRRARAFIESVWNLTPPVALPPLAAAVPAVKEYSFDGNNAWAMQAGIWIDSRVAAKSFEGAVKELKGLVPADAARCFGHGIQIKRSKAGALTIAELKG